MIDTRWKIRNVLQQIQSSRVNYEVASPNWSLSSVQLYFFLDNLLFTIVSSTVTIFPKRSRSHAMISRMIWNCKFRIPNFPSVCLRQDPRRCPLQHRGCVWIIIVRLRNRQQRARWADAFILPAVHSEITFIVSLYLHTRVAYECKFASLRYREGNVSRISSHPWRNGECAN